MVDNDSPSGMVAARGICHSEVLLEPLHDIIA